MGKVGIVFIVTQIENIFTTFNQSNYITEYNQKLNTNSYTT